MITSRQNSRVKDLAALQQKQTRKDTGLTIAEGCRLVREALLYAEPRTLVLSEVLIGTEIGEELRELARERSIEIIEIDESCYRKISGLKNPEGAAAIVACRETSLTDILTEDSRLIVTAGIQNPGNAGAIVRVAEAAGASGCIFLEGVDLTHPHFLRAGAGSSFRLPCASSERSLFLAAAQKLPIRIIAAAKNGDGIPYAKAVYNTPVAICIGAEGKGLPENIIQAASSRIFIPMEKPVESLNAAVAAGIILYRAGWGITL
ncbi:MAG: RNA methyltransferase [Candidatus Auribacterota bacterium]|nr:RNA methyltransferase [Candidatus Auribacterota bacterium]